jgi:glutamyl-tRNA reductase
MATVHRSAPAPARQHPTDDASAADAAPATAPATAALGLIGLSWRHASADDLARLTLPREHRAAALRALAAALEVDELLYLATCNRVEIAFAGGAAIDVPERRRRLLQHFDVDFAPRRLRAWAGDGAIEHLFLVASGLDSARAGESEITGQLKTAASECAGAGLLGPTLRGLVDDALRVARRVRPVTEGHVGRASLADLALAHIVARLKAQPGAVALVGVSPMTLHCANALTERGVPTVLVNRSVDRAMAVAPEGVKVRSLEAFRLSPDVVSALLLATAAPEPLFDAADCARLAKRGSAGIPPLVVDLGVPAALRPEEAERAGMAHIGMDRITRAAEADREEALAALGEARALVDAALDERRSRAWSELVDPTIVALRRRFADRTHLELERLLQHDLHALDDTQREVLRRWAAQLSHQLAHVPSRGLRDLAATAGPEAAAEFLAVAEPELAEDLRRRMVSR